MVGYFVLQIHAKFIWGDSSRNWEYVVFAPLWIPCKILGKIFPGESTQWEIAVYVILAILALIYLAARIFLLVECFINLSQLPPEVYQVPQWA